MVNTIGGGLDEEIMVQKEEKVVEFEEKKTRRPCHYWTVDGHDYKLKLTTRTIEQVERKYGRNILTLVSDDGVPPLSVMLTIIQAAMTKWEHGISYHKIQDLFDKWVEDGGNQVTFLSEIVMPTLAVSGFFTEKQGESMQEEMANMDEML